MMESLEIRDRRFRLQQEIESLQKQIAGIQEACPHEHREDDEGRGQWRCRDCDLIGELESATEEADAQEVVGEGEPANEGGNARG